MPVRYTKGLQEQEQALKQGYTIGTEPVPPVRQYGGLTTGVISDAEKERRRKEKIARGEPLTQEDL